MNYAHLIPGLTYELTSGGTYRCMRPSFSTGYYEANLRRESDGWTLVAYGTRTGENGKICWDYSKGGHWEPEEGTA